MTRVGGATAFRSRGHSCWGGCGGPDQRQPTERCSIQPWRWSTAGLLFTQKSWSLVRRRHSRVGGEAQQSASPTKGESANVMSLDFTHFTQLRQSLFTSSFVTRLFCRSKWVKKKNLVYLWFLVFWHNIIKINHDWKTRIYKPQGKLCCWHANTI